MAVNRSLDRSTDRSIHGSIKSFLSFLRYNRNVSPHTLRAYETDLAQLVDHLAAREACAPSEVPVHRQEVLEALKRNEAQRNEAQRNEAQRNEAQKSPPATNV